MKGTTVPDDPVSLAAERAKRGDGGEPPNGYATTADLLRLEMRMDQRLTRLETTFETRWETVATKEDLQALKGWALRGVIIGIISTGLIVTGIVTTVLKLFS